MRRGNSGTGKGDGEIERFKKEEHLSNISDSPQLAETILVGNRIKDHWQLAKQSQIKDYPVFWWNEEWIPVKLTS